MKNKKVLVTGSSGFIGFHVSKKLLQQGYIVFGIDNMNDYYDKRLKQDRLNILKNHENYKFYKTDLREMDTLFEIFKNENPEFVIHLAAQAGVRYSLEKPRSYIDSNIVGTFNILELCREFPVKHLVYASSSSVYGMNEKLPFEENDLVDKPASLYAATKKSNELMAFAYSHLYGIKTTGLRFFTVYGPYGRPDMAYYKFLNLYFSNKKIKLYNNGDINNDMYRDFTYIDDIVEATIRILFNFSKNDKINEIINIGNNSPVKLSSFVEKLEEALGKSLKRNISFQKIYEDIKPGDVKHTYASTKKLKKLINFIPKTKLSDGLKLFCDWYVEYYNIYSKKGE